MTIQIPDDVARGLEGIAAAEHKSVEEVAVERLRCLVDKTSPEAVLRLLRERPRPSADAIQDLNAAIEEGRVPVHDEGVFDR